MKWKREMDMMIVVEDIRAMIAVFLEPREGIRRRRPKKDWCFLGGGGGGEV